MTEIQFAIIEKLFPNKSLMVVGDPVQSIMAFRGAKPAMFERDFEPSAPEKDGGEWKKFDLQLSCSFRFGQKIVDVLNKFLHLREKSFGGGTAGCFRLQVPAGGTLTVGSVDISPASTKDSLKAFLLDRLSGRRNVLTSNGELCFIGRSNSSALTMMLQLLDLCTSFPEEIGSKVKLQLMLKDRTVTGFIKKYQAILGFLLLNSNDEGFDHRLLRAADRSVRDLKGIFHMTNNEAAEALKKFPTWWAVATAKKKETRAKNIDATALDESVPDREDGGGDGTLGLTGDLHVITRHVHSVLCRKAIPDFQESQVQTEADVTRAATDVKSVLATVDTILSLL